MSKKKEEFIKRINAKVSDVYETPANANILVYAPAGVGKTTLAALAPKPMVISVEGGLSCLRKLKPWQDKLDIKTYPVDGFTDLNDIYEYLRDYGHDRETVVIDTLTETQKKSMDGILDDPNRDTEKYPRDKPILQDYGRNTQQMRKLIRAFRDLPMNVIFTSHDMENKDDETGAVQIMPSLTPKLATDVIGYVDVVGYLYVADDEGTRKMLTQPKGKWTAKDRFGMLGAGMTEPTGYEILNILTEGAVKVPDWLEEIKQEVKNNG